MGGSVRRGRGDAACYVVVRESRGTPRQVGSSGTRVLSSIGYCAPPRYLIGACCYWNMSSSLNGSDAMSVSNALLFSPTRPNLTTISSWAAPSHRAVAAGLHRCTVSHCWASTLRRANGRPPSWSRSSASAKRLLSRGTHDALVDHAGLRVELISQLSERPCRCTPCMYTQGLLFGGQLRVDSDRGHSTGIIWSI